MKRMFRTEPIDLTICPRRNPDIDELPSVWSLMAPALAQATNQTQLKPVTCIVDGDNAVQAFYREECRAEKESRRCKASFIRPCNVNDATYACNADPCQSYLPGRFWVCLGVQCP